MSGPQIDLDTAVRRDRQRTTTAGTIQVAAEIEDGTRVTFSVSDAQEITAVVLTPTEARQVATALEEAATQAATPDTEALAEE